MGQGVGLGRRERLVACRVVVTEKGKDGEDGWERNWRQDCEQWKHMLRMRGGRW